MSIQKRTRGGKTRFIARYRTPDGRERSKSFEKRREALEWENKQLSDLAAGRWVDPTKGKILVRDYARDWQATTPNPRTRKTYERLLVQLGDLSDYPLGALRPSHLRAWHQALISGRPWQDGTAVSASTARTLWAMLATMLSRAVEDGLISHNPADGHRPASPRGIAVRPADVPTVEEVETLAVAAEELDRDQLATMIRVTALTGLRAGEIGGLRVRDIDFLRRRLHVTAQAVTDVDHPGRDLRVPLKTPSSHRVIPLPRVAVELLAEHLRRHPQPAEGPVFVQPSGRLWTAGRTGAWMRKVCVQAGVKYRFHSLRHHYASRLIAAGVDVITVQSALGHASASMTLGVYAHLWPSSDDRLRAALDDDFCGTNAGRGEGSEGVSR